MLNKLIAVALIMAVIPMGAMASSFGTYIKSDDGVVGTSTIESRGIETSMSYTGSLSTLGQTTFEHSMDAEENYIGVASGLDYEGRNGLFGERLMNSFAPKSIEPTTYGCVFGPDKPASSVDNSSRILVGGYNAGKKMSVGTTSIMKGSSVQYEHSSVGTGTGSIYESETGPHVSVSNNYMATGNYTLSHKFNH